MERIYQKIKKETGAKIFKNISLKKYASLRIGGVAKLVAIPKNSEDLKKILKIINANKSPYLIIGAGSNVLFPDKEFPGVVIKLSNGLNEVKISKNVVTAESGVMLPRLIKLLAKEGLQGLEFAAGVPATVGGAVVMNLGAFGSQISKYIQSVKVLDLNGNEKILTKKDLKFNYRSSSIYDDKLTVIETTFKFKKGDPKNILKKISKYLKLRWNTQPKSAPNAGSIFKNPDDDYAGKLIESCGLKGMRIGDAQVSKKHANFIINLGDAKASDVVSLINKIKQTVYQKFNVNLEPEIKIMQFDNTSRLRYS